MQDEKEFYDMSDEELKLALKVREESYNKSRKFRLLFIILAIPIYALTLFYVLNEDKFINKKEIQNNLIIAINNGATLDVIKNIYANRQTIQSTDIIKRYFSSNSYYNYNTNLSKILYDIESNYFLYLENSNIDIDKTVSVIKHYSIVNPFDSLEVSQKNIFTNIRLKLDEDKYKLAQNDLEKIATELTQQNNLVNQYLKDSTNSFWISISALVFSAILGLLQLYLSREEKQKQIISESLTNHWKKNM